jgi:hypothetical protein
MLACDTAGFAVKDHFPAVKKMVEMPSKPRKEEPDFGFPDVRKTKNIIDYQLSRYACYLIVQNGDPRKEMIANLFRISQTQSKITRENIRNKELASFAHFTVGKEVREAIMRLGGVMPEDLPTPEKGIIELEKEAIKKLKEQNKIMLDE